MIKSKPTLSRALWLLLALWMLPLAAQAQSERIVIIQKKKHLKKNRVEISIFSGVVPSNPFLTYIPLEGRLGFHLSEGFSIELGGGYYPPLGSGTIKSVINDDLKRYPHFLGVRLYEQQVFYGNLDLAWTPIYGKMQVLGLQWISRWEIAIQLGGGITGVYNYERAGRFNNDKTNPIKIRPTLNVGVGARFWLTDWLTMRVDIREYLFQKQIGKGGLSQHLSMLLGLSVVI